MSHFPGESTFVLTLLTHSMPLDATIYRAEWIDCVARLNTASLIQAHFPGFLRNSQTWVERCGWEGEYDGYPSNLRLRCLLVLARYAAGQTDAVRKSDVEAIASRSIERLECELLELLAAIAAPHLESWVYDTDRCGASEDTQPEWNIDAKRGLTLLCEAFRRLSGSETIDSLEGFPGRKTSHCVQGDFVEWNSVHLYFVMPQGETYDDDDDEDSHWMTRAIKQWAWNPHDEATSPACDTRTARSNVYDFARYWGRSGPGYPSVIRREDFDWLRDELARPRFGHASHKTDAHWPTHGFATASANWIGESSRPAVAGTELPNRISSL